jgi:hypothetical protein
MRPKKKLPRIASLSNKNCLPKGSAFAPSREATKDVKRVGGSGLAGKVENPATRRDRDPDPDDFNC